MADTIFQGEDKKFEITITDAAGTAIDLNTIDGIIIYVIDKYEKTIKKYSLNAQSGFEALTISDAGNGKVTFKLQSATTTPMETGLIKADRKSVV